MWPVLDLAPGDRRQLLRIAADLEESGADAFGRRARPNLRRICRLGAVVESDDHLMVGERNRLRVGLEADIEAALGSDGRHSRRAELVGPAFGGGGSADPDHQRHQRPGNPH